jgi:hypothetical protein
MLREKDTVQDLSNAVKADLARNFRLCDTAEFLQKNLSVPPELLDLTLATLTKKGVYDGEAKRWKGMPMSDQVTEDRHYDPFCNTANQIRSSVERYTADLNETRTQSAVKGIWLNRATKSPKSANADSSSVRPDLLLATTTDAIHDLDVDIANAEITKSGAQDNDRAKKQARSAKLVCFVSLDPHVVAKVFQAAKLSVWWRQIHTPVEFKTSTSEKDSNEAVNQLCYYLRMILREQLDRRFVMGLVVCFDQLTVLFNDRSGLLGTSTVINIHKVRCRCLSPRVLTNNSTPQNPRDFIQVIAAFAFLDAQDIGWDPSMKVYDPAKDQSFPSYQIGNQPEIFGKNIYSTHWEVDVPAKDENLREKVITVRALSTVGAEVMCGRASVVWEVVKWQERFNPNEVRTSLKLGS